MAFWRKWLELKQNIQQCLLNMGWWFWERRVIISHPDLERTVFEVLTKESKKAEDYKRLKKLKEQ